MDERVNNYILSFFPLILGSSIQDSYSTLFLIVCLFLKFNYCVMLAFITLEVHPFRTQHLYQVLTHGICLPKTVGNVYQTKGSLLLFSSTNCLPCLCLGFFTDKIWSHSFIYSKSNYLTSTCSRCLEVFGIH